MRLRIQKNPPSGTIVMTAVENRNALSIEMIEDLIQAFGDFHREKAVRAVVLSSSGPTFCSGVDIKQWHTAQEQENSMELWHSQVTALQDLLETMLRYPKPIIVAMDGPVFGAGISLVLAADLVIGTPHSTLYSNAPKIGLVSGLVAPLLTFRLGASLAARILMANEPVSAAEASSWGLMQYQVASEHVWVKAHEIATRIAETSSESMQMTKRLLNEMIGETLWTHMASGAAVMATICSTESATEGMKSFIEKRAAKFP